MAKRRKSTAAKLQRERRERVIAERSAQSRRNIEQAIARTPEIIRANGGANVKLQRFSPTMWNKLSDDAKRNYAKAVGALMNIENVKRLDYARTTPYKSAPKIRVSVNDRVLAAMPSMSEAEIAAVPNKAERKKLRKQYGRINRAKNKVMKASQYEARLNAQHATTVADQRRRERRALTSRTRGAEVFGTQDIANASQMANVLNDYEWVDSANLGDLETEVASRARELGLASKSSGKKKSAAKEKRKAENAKKRRIRQDARRGDIYGRRERQRQLEKAVTNAAETGTPLTMDMYGDGDVQWWGNMIGDTSIGRQFNSLSRKQRYWLMNASSFMRLIRDNFDIAYSAKEGKLELVPAHNGSAMGAVYGELRDWMTVAKNH